MDFHLNNEPGIASQKVKLGADMGGSLMSMGTESDLLYASPREAEGVHSGANTGADYDPAVGRPHIAKSIADQTFPDLPGAMSAADLLYAPGAAPGAAPGGAPGAPPGAICVDFYSTFIEKVFSYDSLFQKSSQIFPSEAKMCIAELREVPTSQVDIDDAAIPHLVGKSEAELRILLRKCPMRIVSDLDPGIDIETLTVVES